MSGISDDDLMLGLGLIFATMKYKPRGKTRRKWVERKNWNEEQSSPRASLSDPLAPQAGDIFFKYFGMGRDHYRELLTLVSPYIKRRNTVMRDAVQPHERLEATLLYLATGKSYMELQSIVNLSVGSLCNIIPETCYALYEVLSGEYMKDPKPEEWQTIAEEFEEKWHFPNCFGVIGAKHIRIITPPEDNLAKHSKNYDFVYFNHKGYFSLILLLVTNANHEVTFFDLDCKGRNPEKEMSQNNKFQRLLTGLEGEFPNSEIKMSDALDLPPVFIGGKGLPLCKNILTPFLDEQMSEEKKVFNYRLSRARSVVENVFGIMTSKFRILCTENTLKLKNMQQVVKACIVLHNYLVRNCKEEYLPQGAFYNEDLENGKIYPGLVSCQLDGLKCTSSKDERELVNGVRDKYLKYFNEEGSLEWQHQMI